MYAFSETTIWTITVKVDIIMVMVLAYWPLILYHFSIVCVFVFICDIMYFMTRLKSYKWTHGLDNTGIQVEFQRKCIYFSILVEANLLIRRNTYHDKSELLIITLD